MKVIVCETLLKPLMTPVSSSRNPDLKYTVIGKTLLTDPVCTCPGFQFRGHCRHVEEQELGRCTYHRAWMEHEDTLCPICGSRLIDFEMSPEL